MHSGVAIDLLAHGAGAGSRQIKRHSEKRSGEERPVPGCDESRQLHSGVGGGAGTGPRTEDGVQGLEGQVRGKDKQRVELGHWGWVCVKILL